MQLPTTRAALALPSPPLHCQRLCACPCCRAEGCCGVDISCALRGRGAAAALPGGGLNGSAPFRSPGMPAARPRNYTPPPARASLEQRRRQLLPPSACFPAGSRANSIRARVIYAPLRCPRPHDAACCCCFLAPWCCRRQFSPPKNSEGQPSLLRVRSRYFAAIVD